MKTVAVVIPVYKKQLSAYEKISLMQCCKVLGNYDLILAKPHSLDIGEYINHYPALGAEAFDDYFFASIKGYNQLMLSPQFYQRFLRYDYILIYQLDAFVFKNDLSFWCESSYDYIGAPWIVKPKKLYKHIKLTVASIWHYRLNRKIAGSETPTRVQFYNTVGNGGFSLRRVEKFYNIALSEQATIDYFIRNSQDHHFNEDVFWSMEVNRSRKRLRIPTYRKALLFSIEEFPDYALHLNKGQLPFGCHAWNLFTPFWKPIFEKLGYEL